MIKHLRAGLGICSSNFGENRLFIAKNEKSERPERLAQDRSFLLSDLSESHMVAQCSFVLSNLSDPLTLLRRNKQIFSFF